MSDEQQRSLDELGRRMEERGFVYRDVRFFATSGIVVGTRPIPKFIPIETPHGTMELDVSSSERRVALYASPRGWAARVTPHGGPHWIRGADTLDELEAIALEALGTSIVPPGPDWRIADDAE
ncbi:hypothetical protein HUA74_28160 [Myxococcus sp. CA051A]|uniref:hypothetical protein n=1 Tax=unclassified Myxococcus TaxID=2648731 RepID=UPI00157AA6A4|nr:MULTISPECIES: hypothetical protein [unclassified Myxococcus]NTX05452.1 hypothetical protein [Myxococcus sp. CA040A]NTX64538.1 hypothetical protein [Myxococcus sp. CA051A]